MPCLFWKQERYKKPTDGKNCTDLVSHSVMSLRPMNYSLPGSSIHGVLQARILEWVVIPLISANILSWGSISVRSCGFCSVSFFFFFVWISSHLEFSFPRRKPWVHSMAFNCSCTLPISKFQLKISTLLWVSKWNTLIKLECLALFQMWELDHAGCHGGFDFLFSVKENYPTQLLSPQGCP